MLLLSKIIDYLGCGNLEKPSTRPDGAIFVVYKFSDICEKIIPKGALRPPTFQPPAAETVFFLSERPIGAAEPGKTIHIFFW